MDCLRIVSLALGLLAGLSGCKTTNLPAPSAAGPLPITQSATSSGIPANVVVKPKEHPPRPPILVAGGQLLAGEAEAISDNPSRQAELRQQARQQYLDAIKADPKYVPAYQELARLQVVTGSHAEARQTYQKALKLAPRNASLWYEMGVCHNYDRNWKDALHCLRQAVRLDPQQREYSNALAVVLARMGQVNESLAAFQKGTTEGEAHYRLARTLQYLNQPELSREQLLQALAKDPQLVSARSMLAEMNAPPAPEGIPVPAATQQAAAIPYQAPSASPVQQTSYTFPVADPVPPTSTAPEAPKAPAPAPKAPEKKPEKKQLIVPPMPHP